MKNVYSNLYAMRAIVCVAHERVSDEHPYNFSFSIFNFQFPIRSGMICFFDITNYLHELGTAARRKNIWKFWLKFDIMNT